MKRFFGVLTIAAITATALFATVASANVAYDDYRVGSVDKADVQALLGGNNAVFQSYAPSVTFTNKLVSVKDTSWTCSDGSTQHSVWTVTSVRPIDHTIVRNTGNGQVTRFNLNGFSKTDFGTVTGSGERSPSYACPAGSYFTGLNVSQGATSTVQVTGNGITVDLPVTPAV